MGPAVTALARWWFEPVALGRIAVLRTVVYAFIWIDVLLTTHWVADHADVPGALYQPLALGRLLPLPTPTAGFVQGVMVALLASAAVAATNRAPRLLGWTVALLYLQWMLIGQSYGKVDHDRFAFLVLLFALATVGRARWGVRSPSEAAGWAVKMTMVAVVATYFLSVFAKARYGDGLMNWLDSATISWAVVRRGTLLAEPLLQHPWTLQASQYGVVALEMLAPLLLVFRGRRCAAMLTVYASFHLVTFATIGIIFLPHLVAMLVFVPLERLPVPWRRQPAGSERPTPSPLPDDQHVLVQVSPQPTAPETQRRGRSSDLAQHRLR